MRAPFFSVLLAIPVVLALVAPPSARAEDRDHRGHEEHRERERHEEFERHERFEHERHRHEFFRDRFEVRFFSPLEFDLWREGRWVHGWYGGRYGWWWVSDGYWYWYQGPIYPYPGYVGTVMAEPAPPPVPTPPPPVVVTQAPPPPAPTGAPPAASWYYCDNPQGYYPYVSSCGGPWRQVPALPPAQ
jgi:hypothetical protein